MYTSARRRRNRLNRGRRSANLVDTTETQNRQGSRDKAAHDNVIRLPRDWLGPREELVPFGPAAYREEPGQAKELPRNADDFWGGADLPDDDGAAPSVAATPAGQRWWSLPTRSGLPRPRVRLSIGLKTVVLSALGVLGILAAIGLVLGSASRKPSALSAHAHAPHRAIPAAAGFDPRATDLRDTAADRELRARAREAASVRRQAQIRRRRERADARRHHEHRAKPAVQPVNYTTPAPAAASNGGDSSSVSGSGSASTSSTPTSTSSTAAIAASGTSNSSTSSSNSSSSRNQPAIGANGTLGPGSSPDG